MPENFKTAFLIFVTYVAFVKAQKFMNTTDIKNAFKSLLFADLGYDWSRLKFVAIRQAVFYTHFYYKLFEYDIGFICPKYVKVLSRQVVLI